MTEMPYDRDDLALIDHYVDQTKQRLAEQACRIRRLTTAGRDTIEAEEAFQGMQKTLSGLRAYREQLVFELLGQ
jgi:hypothetical protein